MKRKKTLSDSVKLLAISLILGILSGLATGETVGVFYNPTTPQHTFAAGDIQTALEAKSFTVEIKDLATLSDSYTGKKVVIALASNAQVTALLAAQGGSAAGSLGEQAYALRTTTAPQLSYWALGGDDNGAMYGGLQIAENISFNGFVGSYNSQETPFLLNRGMKLNLPLDKRIPTYIGNWNSYSARDAIPHVWDMTFWKTLIDQQARSRYNMLSIWVHHPFPALVRVADYPNACLPDIQRYDGSAIPNTNHDQRVAFWREVMQYAHSRGMKFYFFNWNVYVDYASTQYPALTKSTSNTTTIDYLSKSMKALLETYPDLDGFGITTGDGMSGGSEMENAQWSWDAYGSAIKDYLIANPSRQFNVIHRSVGTSPSECKPIYADQFTSVPNAAFNMSAKYAMAHMYSATAPRWTTDIQTSYNLGMKTWLTFRNDDYFYLNLGDPQFVRDFMAGIPYKDCVVGMYVGIDGYNPSRARLFKDPSLNNQLEVERRWYMEMLWGRISYNPATSDEVFKNLLGKRYALVASPSTNLFNAWTLASRSLPKVTELIMADWELDYHWYPEGCWSNPTSCGGFRTISAVTGDQGGFAGQDVAKGSNLCNIATSAAGGCGGKKSSYQLADEMQADAANALSLINAVESGGNVDLEVAIENVKQMAYLSTYYAHKIRGATYNKAGNTAMARTQMSLAYCAWMSYSRSMDTMYKADSFRRFSILPDWKFADAAVLKEYTDLGGQGIPCSDTNPPTPNPAQFAQVPVALSPTEITMTSVTGTDAEGSVHYLFTEAGGKTSGWQSSPVYVDTKLQPGTQYTYTVTIGDLGGNQTAPSGPFSAFTHGDPDIVKNNYIDIDDFAVLADHWLENDCYQSALCAGADLNADGSVRLGDLKMLAASWLMQILLPGFKESGGLVCMEAEHYDALELRAPEPETWKQASVTPGYVGDGYMWTDGNFTVMAPIYTQGTRMLYPIVFSTTGAYNVYVRRWSDSTRASNSAYAGLDGAASTAYDNTQDYDQWIWKSLGTVTVSTPGVKTLDIVRREEGYKIDRIVLTKGAIPTGNGPAESPR